MCACVSGVIVRCGDDVVDCDVCVFQVLLCDVEMM